MTKKISIHNNCDIAQDISLYSMQYQCSLTHTNEQGNVISVGASVYVYMYMCTKNCNSVKLPQFIMTGYFLKINSANISKNSSDSL